ncbi:MAG: AAA family ATPase [Methanomassiliicoccaceae archaeon]|nr:AAA family ATPase [Methanomassiliicoccaceae archaeon]
MERLVYGDLLKWKGSGARKPLLLEGVRQCGKTYILKEFGEREYGDVAYFTFLDDPAAHEIFQADLRPERIVRELGLARGKKIEPGRTLIILDEIQFCNRALASLKFFCEDAPEYHIACAGSLLGVITSKPLSFPVGKVNRIKMHPMSFKEFLLANSEGMLVEHIDAGYPADDIAPFIGRLKTYLDYYFLTGGLPEAVKAWVENEDIEEVDSILDTIIKDYESDFSKHASEPLSKLTLAWNSIPAQLAKDNRKFVFGHVKAGMRSRDLEDALEWLVNAGLVHKVRRVERPEIPLPMFADNMDFKVYLSDVGVLRRMSKVPSSFMFGRDKEHDRYRGAAAENYVLNELVACNGDTPYYWTSGNAAEVDFVAQIGDAAVPIEVKAGSNKSKSLPEFIRRYGPKAAVITSPRENRSDVVAYVPLCLFWKVRDVALEMMRGG